MPDHPHPIREVLLQLAAERAPEKTFCPSEAARRLDHEHWRAYMAEVKAQAQILVKEGRLQVTQKGKVVNWDETQGPVRLQKRP